jgi:hypothetical protein
MAAAVGPGFGLVVDDHGRPLAAVRPLVGGEHPRTSGVSPLMDQGERDALGRARRVLAGGAR